MDQSKKKLEEATVAGLASAGCSTSDIALIRIGPARSRRGRPSVRSGSRAPIHLMLTSKSRPMDLLTAPGSTPVIDATAATPSGCAATSEPRSPISLRISSSLKPGSITRPPFSGQTYRPITRSTEPYVSRSISERESAEIARHYS
jgi:hypothetical protein